MNDLGYRHLRVVESRRRERLRAVLVIGLGLMVTVLFYLLLFGIIFWPNTGPVILR